jgi:mRNA interferase RelE/StbE
MVQGRFLGAPTKHFLRELKKLPSPTKKRVTSAIEQVLLNPYTGVRLRGELEGLLRWRVGNYRIIYKIDEGKHLVILIDVGPRKSVYD